MNEEEFQFAYGRELVSFPELGSGSQFRAFDMHNGRALKLPLTVQETALVVAKRRHNMQPLSKEQTASIEARVDTAIGGKARIPAMVSHSFYDSRGFLELLGNPVLVDANSVLPKDADSKKWGDGRVIYTQDKLSMIGDTLRALAGQTTLGKGDVQHLKQIIDEYVEQTYALWEYGFADYVFKLGDAGYNAENKLIFADLGEFTSDPEFMRKVLADRRWLHATIADKIDFPQIPKQVQDYYIETLDNAFTEAHLMARWGRKHQCSSCDASGDAISSFIASKVAEIDYVDRW
jgi:hypothetical protein